MKGVKRLKIVRKRQEEVIVVRFIERNVVTYPYFDCGAPYLGEGTLSFFFDHFQSV